MGTKENANKMTDLMKLNTRNSFLLILLFIVTCGLQFIYTVRTQTVQYMSGVAR